MSDVGRWKLEVKKHEFHELSPIKFEILTE